MHSYQPTYLELWQCRADAMLGEYFSHNVISYDLNNPITSEVESAILGFKSDLGVALNHGRVGAKLAPDIIRQFLSYLAIPYIKECFDCGDIVVDDNENLIKAQQLLGKQVTKLAKASIVPIILGGGHETAYGHYLGLLNAIEDDIAIINFDAHFDLRPLINNSGNSGTPFRQIFEECQSRKRKFNYYCLGIQPRANTKSLYDFANSVYCQYLEADKINNHPEIITEFINNILNKHKHIYLTVCLDVFHYSFAPGVSAPQALGINPFVVLKAISQIKESQKVIGFDIVELNPKFDIDNHTARLAANLVYQFYYS